MADDNGRYVTSEDVPSGEGRVRMLTLTRAAKRNALDTQFLRELSSALAKVESDPDVRALVLTGAGPSFSAGGDTSEFAREDLDSVIARARLMAEVLSLPQRLSVPVITAARGSAIGAGAALALSADLVVAADDLTIGFPELPNGSLPAFVMPSVLRSVPRHVAFEMLTTGRRIDAQEALALGLVNRVTASDVIGEAVKLATRYAAMDRDTALVAKRLFYEQLDLPYDAAVQTGLDALIVSLRSSPGQS